MNRRAKPALLNEGVFQMRRRVIASLIAVVALSACAHQTPQAMPGMAWSLNDSEEKARSSPSARPTPTMSWSC